MECMAGLGTLQLATVVLLEFPEETLRKQQLQLDNRELKNLDSHTLWPIHEQQKNAELLIRTDKI